MQCSDFSLRSFYHCPCHLHCLCNYFFVCLVQEKVVCKKGWFSYQFSMVLRNNLLTWRGRYVCAAGVQMSGCGYTFLQRANKTFTECIQNMVQLMGSSAPWESPLCAGGSLKEEELHGASLLMWNRACIYCMLFSCHNLWLY